MKIHGITGPNPRALHMFLLEKKLEIERVEVDIFGGENRRPQFMEKNPAGQSPAIELDDGRVFGESAAIFEYLEEKYPSPPLIGTTAEERLETRCWQRRVELRITEHLYNGFRFAEGIEMFRPRIRVLPEAASGLKATAQDNLAWLESLMAGRSFIIGERFTIVDIILYAALDFVADYGQKLDPKNEKLTAWFARVGARPSATGSQQRAAGG